MPQQKKTLSATATSLLTLLNNMDELIIESSNRQDAREVMKAFRSFAKTNRFDIPEEKVNNFLAVLLDSRPYTLSSILHDIAADVIKTDYFS